MVDGQPQASRSARTSCVQAHNTLIALMGTGATGKWLERGIPPSHRSAHEGGLIRPGHSGNFLCWVLAVKLPDGMPVRMISDRGYGGGLPQAGSSRSVPTWLLTGRPRLRTPTASWPAEGHGTGDTTPGWPSSAPQRSTTTRGPTVTNCGTPSPGRQNSFHPGSPFIAAMAGGCHPICTRSILYLSPPTQKCFILTAQLPPPSAGHLDQVISDEY